MIEDFGQRKLRLQVESCAKVILFRGALGRRTRSMTKESESGGDDRDRIEDWLKPTWDSNFLLRLRRSA